MKLIEDIKAYYYDFLNILSGQLGFDNFTELGKSLYNSKLLLYSGNAIISIASLTKIFSDLFGLKPQILFGFIVLIVLEFWTGIGASLHQGNKVQSRKMMRVFTKLAVYAFLLFGLNSMTGLQPFDFWGLKISLWDYIFWVFFCGISFKLFVSILENLDRMGFEETGVVHKLLHGKLQLFIDFDRKKTEDMLEKLNSVPKIKDNTISVDNLLEEKQD